MFAVIMPGKGNAVLARSRERMPKHLLDILGERRSSARPWTGSGDRPRRENPGRHGPKPRGGVIRQLPEIPLGTSSSNPSDGTPPLHRLGRAPHPQPHPGRGNARPPSDHRIGDDAVFRRILVAAAGEAIHGDPLVTVGILPRTRTGYGYIEQGDLASTFGDDKIYRSGPSARSRPGRRRTIPSAGRFLMERGCSSGKHRRS